MGGDGQVQDLTIGNRKHQSVNIIHDIWLLDLMLPKLVVMFQIKIYINLSCIISLIDYRIRHENLKI